MNNGPTKLRALPWLFLILVASAGRLLGQGCDTCDPCAPPCEPSCAPSCDSPCESPCAPSCAPATCSILMPQLVTEYQTRCVVRYRAEVRRRMVTVYRDVPSTRAVQEEYTVLVPETRVRTVAETINHPVYGDIQLRTTTMTPEVEARQGSQTVTQMVPVQEERVVQTGWSPTPAPPAVAGDPDPDAPPLPAEAAPPVAAPPVGDACNTCCNPCTPCKVCVTSWRPVSQQITVKYPLTRFKPEARLDNVSFYEYQPETKLHNESYVVQVPEKRTRTRYFTVMRPVAEQRPERYTVMVPYQELIQVPVVTRRCVEQPVITR